MADLGLASEFAGSFVLILVAAELFTNGVEWLGFRLGLGESAAGSLLAAVGTALPETLIPAVSVLLVGGQEVTLSASGPSRGRRSCYRRWLSA